MLTADVVKDYARTVLLPLEGLSKKSLAGHFSPLLKKGRADLKFEGFARPAFSFFIDMRYLGQSYELTLPYRPETAWTSARASGPRSIRCTMSASARPVPRALSRS